MRRTVQLCKTAGRAYQGHDISTCWFISKFDKMDIVDAFTVNSFEDDEDAENVSPADENPTCCHGNPTCCLLHFSMLSTNTTLSRY